MQHFRAGPGEKPLGGGVGQGGAEQGDAGEYRRAPLAGQQQQGDQHAGDDELGAEIAEAGNQHHAAVDGAAAMLLNQCHQALVELHQVGKADEHRCQHQQAQRGDQAGTARLSAQAAVDAHPDQQRQACRDYGSLCPETFGQRQAHGCTSGPAGQQIGHCPTCTSDQADRDKTRQRHVEHAGDHRQHGPQRADEAPDQQAGDAIALKVVLGAADPFRMMAQQRQAANVLMKTPAKRVRDRITQQAAEKTEEQGFPQRQRAAAGQHGNGEQQYGAGHDDPGDGQALDAGHQKNRHAQPLRVRGQPAGQAVEPWAHRVSFLVSVEKSRALRPGRGAMGCACSGGRIRSRQNEAADVRRGPWECPVAAPE